MNCPSIKARLKLTALLLAGMSVAACEELDATFEPGCIAFEGDRITVSGERFEWQRFTDQIEIGVDGRPVDPFPDYPKRGSVSYDGGRLALTTDSGEMLPARYLVETEGRVYLLDAEEHAAYVGGIAPPACALVATPAEN